MAKDLTRLIIEYSNKDDFRSQYEYIHENGLSNVDVFDDVLSKSIYAAIHSDKESIDVDVDVDDWIWIKKDDYEIVKKCIKHPKMLHKDENVKDKDEDSEDMEDTCYSYVLLDMKYVDVVNKLENRGFNYYFHSTFNNNAYYMYLHVDWSHWVDKDMSEESKKSDE